MAKSEALPDYLGAFLEVLEAQDLRAQPDRLSALDAAETVAGRPITIKDAMRHPEFKRRYERWEERLRMALADAQVGRVMAGKASATPVIAAMGGFESPSNTPEGNGGNGRPALSRNHAARRGEFGRW